MWACWFCSGAVELCAPHVRLAIGANRDAVLHRDCRPLAHQMLHARYGKESA
jgi:hypothetical protein